ncbi:15955_t:CDS:2, partial [Acaulospora colombiana]
THGILPNLQGNFPGRPGDLSPSDNGRLGRAQGQHDNTFFWIRSGQQTRSLQSFTYLRRYYGFELKYDEFAIRIAEGGAVPRRSRPKPEPAEKKATKASKKRKAKAAAAALAEANMVQSIVETIVDTPEMEEHQENGEISKVEPITDDLQVEEIATAVAEAAEIQKQDGALDESLQENQFTRKSQLDEPSRWANECFVVGDPFIAQKQTQRNRAKSQPGPATAGQTSQAPASSIESPSQVDQKPKLEPHPRTQQRVNADKPSDGSSVSRNQEASRLEL